MKQDVRVEIFYSGAWHDVTAEEDVRAQNPITITRGVGDGEQQLQPAVASLGLDNRDGRYSIRLPTSPLYGLIGRNTPLRIYTGTAPVGAGNSDATDTTSHVAPSVTVPADPGRGILICGWMAPETSGATYTVPASMTGMNQVAGAQITHRVARQLIASSGATGTRTATFSVSQDYCATSVFVSGPTFDPTGAVHVAGTSLAMDGNAGDWWVLVASFASDPAAIGGTLDPVPYPRDTDGGGWFLLADSGNLTVGDAQAQHLRQKVWVKQVKTTNAAHTIMVPPEDIVSETLLTAKRLPGANVTGFSFRFHGEVAQWPVQPTVGGHDVVTPIEAAGITRRIGRQRASIRDVIYRFVQNNLSQCCGYWPMDDLDGSKRIEAVVGLPLRPATVLGVRGLPAFGGRLAPWLPNGSETLTGGGAVSGSCVGGQSGGLAADWLVRASLPPGGSTDLPLSLLVRVSAGAAVYIVQISPNTGLTLFVDDLQGNNLATSNTGLGDLHDGQLHHVRLRVTDGGGTVQNVFVDVDGVNQIATTANTGESTPGAAAAVSFAWDGTADQTLPVQFGQFAVWNETVPGLPDVFAAYFGYQGERPTDRVARVCTEEGIPYALIGDPAEEETLLGPQFPEPPMTVLTDAATAGRGWLYEAREFAGLAYRTPGSAYNQLATFTAAADGGGLMPLVPVPDDQQTANDVTATGRIGGTARSVQESGPLNVQLPENDPNGVGRYETGIAPNVLPSGGLLANQAGWRRNLGTVDEDRHPAIVVDLDANPALTEQAAALDVADRLVVTSPPPWMPPEDLSQLAAGYTETIGTHRRRLTFNCLPESPYHIGEVAHATYGVLQSDSAILNEDLDTTEVGVSFVVGAGPDWADETSPDWQQFDIVIGGERMTVFAVSGAGGTFPNRTQSLNVTRSVNGVVKTHSTGARIEFFHKSYIGL